MVTTREQSFEEMCQLVGFTEEHVESTRKTFFAEFEARGIPITTDTMKAYLAALDVANHELSLKIGFTKNHELADAAATLMFMEMLVHKIMREREEVLAQVSTN